MKLILFGLVLVTIAGCASPWKVQGGPASCKKMCDSWGLEFTAMVGVGSQDAGGPGATACVCQPRSSKVSSIEGAGAASTSLAAPITAAAQAAAQAAAAQAMLMQNQSAPHP